MWPFGFLVPIAKSRFTDAAECGLGNSDYKEHLPEHSGQSSHCRFQMIFLVHLKEIKAQQVLHVSDDGDGVFYIDRKTKCLLYQQNTVFWVVWT